jgi:hypothetical protein
MITWYSMDKNLAVVDHESVTKAEAMTIIDDYFTRLRPKYESGEEAIAETMFGFQKSKSEFVEICINGSDAISFKYEVSVPRQILFLSIPKLVQKERTLRSTEEVKAEVAAFFEKDSASFVMQCGV